jgi:AcrR family transcriptional regulator
MTPPSKVDPRTEHTRRVVLEAASSLLAEEGFERLTVEGVAERSGVARSTIYRNWPDRIDLLKDSFDELCQMAEIPDLGSMEAELRFLGKDLATGLGTAQWAKALPSLVGAAHHDDGLAEAQRKFSADRRRIVGAIFERANGRGEIAEGRDPGQLSEMFASGFFFRFLMVGLPIDEDFVENQVAAITTLASSPISTTYHS